MRRLTVVIEKRAGETPLEALRAWQAAHPRYAGLPACYAGRLDPLASGKLLVLFGDECKRKERHTKLDKEYEIEVTLDLSTDTGDALGLPAYAERETHPDQASLRRALKAMCGTHQVPYPAFSSKTVGGKPLFQYALEGTLDTLAIPEHEETIYRIRHLRTQRLAKAALEERMLALLALAPRNAERSKALGADFRQDAVRTAWTSLFAQLPEKQFTVLTLRVTCGSGTYMRTLANRIGASLGTRGMALSIRRTRIGKFKNAAGLGMWLTSL
jgi:tRNA pseudouridine55 synthase